MSILSHKTKGNTEFKEKVLEVVRNIPKGKTLSYKQVAQKAGRGKAYRAVGSIMRANCDIKIPCHRVIRSDGKAGMYNRGEQKKVSLLKSEGVPGFC